MIYKYKSQPVDTITCYINKYMLYMIYIFFLNILVDIFDMI